VFVTVPLDRVYLTDTCLQGCQGTLVCWCALNFLSDQYHGYLVVGPFARFSYATMLAMSAKKGSKKSKQKKKEAVEEGRDPVLESETLRRIVGVLLVVVSILLVLSVLGLAGIAGEKLYLGLDWLIGLGYFLLPFVLLWLAVPLFRERLSEHSIEPIRAVGVALFFVSGLGIIGVISATHAGIVGALLAQPLVTYFGKIASLVILTGLLLVSLLLLFDSSLWVSLWHKLRGTKTDEVSGEEYEEEAMSIEEIEAAEQAALAAEEVAGDDETDEEAADTEDTATPEDEGEFNELFDEPKKKRGKKQEFQLPNEYTPPPLDLLDQDRGKPNVGDTKARANLIRRTLQHFKIPVEMDEIVVGPTVTRYSLKPAEGVKLSKILALQSNLELALAASPIRIEAPIPGRSLVGIEVPNTAKAIVGLGGLLESPEFAEETVPLFVTLGKDIAGAAHYANIGKMPHLLVAGTTGSGKSIMIHSLITSLLYRNAPERLRFIMVDPKRVELTLYEGIPHLLTPVITDPKKAILSLKWAAKEMDRRYDILQESKVQDINGYHNEVLAPALAHYQKLKDKGKDLEDFDMPDQMPHICIFIDELADIMQAYPRELESVIVRLAQMSRAVGIHLILSTQRPSVNVITGLIKANIPTRIALKVASLVDSRTILDQPGAEKLLGAGDMLYLSGDMAKPRRIQSPFLTTKETKKVVAFLTKHNDYMLDTPIDFASTEGNGEGGGIPFDELEQSDDLDEIYNDVRDFVVKERKASTSLIQRRFKVGYGRAARIMDQLEQNGVIAPSDGTNRPREVLQGSEDALEEAADELLEATETDENEAYER